MFGYGSRWDRGISLEIIANWLDLVNMDGWIPRELILGEEALRYAFSTISASFCLKTASHSFGLSTGVLQ